MPENDDIQIEKQRLKYHHRSYGYKTSKRISLGHFLKNVLWDLGEFPFLGIVCFIIGYVFICAHGQYWSLPLASCCIILLLLCMSAQRLDSKRRNLFECEYPWQLLILVIPLVWSLVQLLPCDGMVRCLSPESWTIWQEASEIAGRPFSPRISISPNQTLDFSLLIFCCLGEAFILCNYCRKRRQLRWIALGIVLTAVMVAVHSFATLLLAESSSPNKPFAVLLQLIVDCSFLNRNHRGMLLGMGCFSAAALLLSVSREKIHVEIHPKCTPSKWVDAYCWLVLSFILIFISLIFTNSRGAFYCVMPLLFVYVIYSARSNYKLQHLKHHRHRNRSMIVLMIIVSAAILMTPSIVAILQHRGVVSSSDMDLSGNTLGRFAIYRDCIPILKDFCITGYGMGGFEDVFHRYLVVENSFYRALVNNAHNDLIEFMLEVGLPVAVIVLTLLGIFMWQSAKVVFKLKDDNTRFLGIGIWLGMLSVLLHELVDYGLRSSANAFVFVAMACIVIKLQALPYDNWMSEDPDIHLIPSQNLPSHRHHHTRKANHGIVPRCLAWLVIAVLMMLFAVQCNQFIGKLQKSRTIGYFKNSSNWEFNLEDCRMLIDMGNLCSAKLPSDGMMHRWNSRIYNRAGSLLMNEAEQAIKENDYVLAAEKSAEAKKMYEHAVEEILCSASSYPSNPVVLRNMFTSYSNLYDLGCDDEELLRIGNMAEFVYLNNRRLAHAMAFNADAWMWIWMKYNSSNSLKRAAKNENIREYVIEKYVNMLNRGIGNFKKIFRNLNLLHADSHYLANLEMHGFEGMKMLASFYFGNENRSMALSIVKEIKQNLLGECHKYVDAAGRLCCSEEAIKWCEQLKYVAAIELNQGWNDANDSKNAFEFFRYVNNLEQSYYCGLLQTGQDFYGGYISDEQCEEYATMFSDGFEIALASAERDCEFGKFDNILRKLLPFVYYPMPLDEKLLESAWELADKCRASIPQRNFSVQKFVYLALSERMYECGKLPESCFTPEELLLELNNMNDFMSESMSSLWIQSHLIPYYLGRYLMAMGKDSEAEKAFEMALAISPNNLYVKSALAKCKGCADERMDDMLKYSLPITGNMNLLYLPYTEDLPEFNQYTQKYSYEMKFLCTGDTYCDFSLALLFSCAGKTLFVKKLIPQDKSSALNWKVGEERTFICTCHPLLDAMVHNQAFVKNKKGMSLIESRISLKNYSNASKYKPILSNFPVFKVVFDEK